MADCSSPVFCCYQQKSEKSICDVCETSENLSMCLCCGFVGCGRYKGEHVTGHLKETQHCFTLDLETQHVRYYVGNDYLGELTQCKTVGESIKLISHLKHSHDSRGRCEFGSSKLNEAILSSRAIAKEWEKKLEDEKQHYELLLQKFEEETEREIAEAVEIALATDETVLKKQAELDNAIKELEMLEILSKRPVETKERLRKKRRGSRKKRSKP